MKNDTLYVHVMMKNNTCTCMPMMKNDILYVHSMMKNDHTLCACNDEE